MSQGPITLPSDSEPTHRRRPQPSRVAEPEPTPAARDDRYASAGVPHRSARSATARRRRTRRRQRHWSARTTTIATPRRPSNTTRSICRPRPRAKPAARIRASTLPCRSAQRAHRRRRGGPPRIIYRRRTRVDTGAGPGVLVTNAAPAITSDIRGPQADRDRPRGVVSRAAAEPRRQRGRGGRGDRSDSVVGRSCEYHGHATASFGRSRPMIRPPTLQWQIPRLDAQAAETLSIDLVPRASRPLELGVTWTHDPVAYADRRRSAGAETQARSHRAGRSAVQQVARLSPDAVEPRHGRGGKCADQSDAARRWPGSGEHV